MSSDFESYLDQVCSRIRARELHTEIRRELKAHLQQAAEEREAETGDASEAREWAIRQMGAPASVGQALNRVHKPRLQWKLLLSVFIFTVLGIAAMIAVDQGRGTPGGEGFIYPKMIFFAGSGLVGMVLLYRIDYRVLQRFAWWIYSLALAGMFVLFVTPPINRAHRSFTVGTFAIDWASVSLLLLAIAFSGLLTRMPSKEPNLETMLSSQPIKFLYRYRLIIAMLLPAYWYIVQPAYVQFGMYILLLSTLSIVSGYARWRIWLMAGGACAAALGILFTQRAQIALERLQAAINPQDDPQGNGYAYMQIFDVLEKAGWLGKGFGYPADQLPYADNQTLIPYLILCFGWLAGLALVLGIGWMLVQMIDAFRASRDQFGKALTAAMLVYVGFPALYGLAASSGRLPLLDVSIPFLAYAGVQSLLSFIAVGLILSVYCRKDMIMASVRS